MENWNQQKQKNYKQTQIRTVLQINDQLEIIRTFKSVLEASTYLKKRRENIDWALKNGYRAYEYFWFWEDEWNDNWRPDLSLKRRHRRLYAYKVIGDKKYEFIGRYKNSKIAATDLQISPTNVRYVALGEKENVKGYFFSETPVNPNDEEIAIELEEQEESQPYNKFLEKKPIAKWRR